tara:strand:- start:9 stop:1031 length:1023 start_codon:yes stop_codon:yes gene_type:complete
MHRIVIISLLVFTIAVSFLRYKVFISFREQALLMEDFNSGTERKLSYSFVENFEETIPNITSTTLPINELKAYYLIKEKNFELAKKRLYQKSKNSYLGIKETYLADLYESQNENDSAYFYRKAAFRKIPRNTRYNTTLFNFVTTRERDTLKLDSVFNLSINKWLIKKDKTNLITYKNYLNNRSYLTVPNNNYNLHFIDSLINLFPEDKELKKIKNIIQVSPTQYDLSDKLSLDAGVFFDSEDFDKALKLYEKSTTLNPYKYENFESIGIIHFKMGDYSKAKKYFDSVINYFDSKSGKSEFFKASILLLNENRIEEGCEILKISISKDYKNSGKLFNAYCN